MKLTKDDIKDFPDLGYMPSDVIEQILKNQEDAGKWNTFGSLASATRNDKIVERLKKRIEEYHEMGLRIIPTDKLQKILEA